MGGRKSDENSEGAEKVALPFFRHFFPPSEFVPFFTCQVRAISHGLKCVVDGTSAAAHNIGGQRSDESPEGGKSGSAIFSPFPPP